MRGADRGETRIRAKVLESLRFRYGCRADTAGSGTGSGPGTGAGQAVSGARLAEEHAVSRNTIWKIVESLRREGYTILGTPRLGYRLDAEPDLLRPAEVTPATGSFGRQVHYQGRTGSTNDMVRTLGLEGAPEGTVTLAERQTAGRGRLGRSWWDGTTGAGAAAEQTGETVEASGAGAPDGGASTAGDSLLLSVLLRPVLPPGEVVALTLLAAVAVARAVERVAGVSLGIKWPNDLLWQERKVGGILCEMVAEAERVAFVVLGIGLNANTPAGNFPPELAGKASSLREATGKRVDRTALARAVLEEVERAYAAFGRDGMAAVREEWLARNVTVGRRVSLATVRERLTGTAVGLGEDGQLLVETAGGIRAFAAGEVTLHGET